jgi:hypothetical protein
MKWVGIQHKWRDEKSTGNFGEESEENTIT